MTQTENIFNKVNYKDVDPEVTIKKIKSILRKYNLSIVIPSIIKPVEGIYSLFLSLKNVSTTWASNGKGRTSKLAIASAYAELIERLSNKMYYIRSFSKWNKEKIITTTGYLYDKNEKIKTTEYLYDLPIDVKIDLFGSSIGSENIEAYCTRMVEINCESIICLPYIDIVNNKIEYLPYESIVEITRSNGMCAGNTKYEALNQGINEILERFCAGEIYFKKLTPPLINTKDIDLQQSTKQVLLDMEYNFKCKLSVFDFSCGYSFPVIGVCATSTDYKYEGKYRLAVGVDRDIEIAISRCITEMFQGISTYEVWVSLLTDSAEPSHIGFMRYMNDLSGGFPKELFGKYVSYAVNKQMFNNSTRNKDNFSLIVMQLQELGFRVLIHWASFLGFPAYHIYVPGISSVLNYGLKDIEKIERMIGNINERYLEDNLPNIKTMGNEDLKKYFNLLEQYNYENNVYQLLKIDQSCSKLNGVNIAFILTVYRLSLEDYDGALYYLEKYIETLESKNDEYYLALKELLHNDKQSESYDEEKLLREKGFRHIRKVVADHKKRREWMDLIDLPCCPNCKKCSIKKKCITRNQVDTAIKINSSGASGYHFPVI